MPNQEESRLRKLRSLALLDSEPDEFFDSITNIASNILDTPISLISLIDNDRQWFKSKKGIDVNETHRDISFCTHALDTGEQLIIENALDDNRFSQNPLVLNSPNIRFYAGIPIKSIEGYILGTLCVIDNKPRKPSPGELEALRDLAQLATKEIQFRERMLEAQMSLDLSVSKFKSLFESAAIGIAMVGPNGAWSEVNDEICRILGYSRSELLSLTFQDITYPDDLDKDLNLLDQLVTGKIERYQIEKRYIKKSGEIVWAELTVSKHLTSNGEIDYYICIIKDKQLENLLRNEAHNDPLTGLPNRRKLEEALPIAIHRAEANQDNLSVLFVDLDGFKSINDTYGHNVGDMLLREVANRIDKCTRQADTVVRYAGDEFIIILEGVKKQEDTQRIAEKILHETSRPAQFGNIHITMTVSIGIAWYSFHDGQQILPAELITLADKAMYSAKQQGKNGIFTVETKIANSDWTPHG